MEAGDGYQVYRIELSSNRMAIGDRFTVWSFLYASEREPDLF